MRESASNTKKCPNCAEVVKSEAIGCRYCGFDFQTGRLPNAAVPGKREPLGCGATVATAICVIVLVFFLIAALGSDGGSDLKLPKKAVKVEAAALAKDWAENSVRAAERYKDRPLIVSAEVRRVVDADDSGAAIILRTGGYRVASYLRPDQKPAASALRAGDEINLSCKHLSDLFDGELSLVDCRLEPKKQLRD